MKYPIRKLTHEQQAGVDSFLNDSSIAEEHVNCLNCGANNTKELFVNDRYGIPQKTVMCKSCGMVYSNPRISEGSAKDFYESDLYRKIYGGIDDPKVIENQYSRNYQPGKSTVNMDKYYPEMFFDFINTLYLDIKSICEIGAGGGWNLTPFVGSGLHVVGYEPSQYLCELGRERGVDMREGFLDKVEGQFDLLILKHVLEHLHSPITILNHLKNHINKYLFIEVPGIQTMMPSLQNAHTYYFSQNTLKVIGEKAGYTLLKMDYCKSNDFIFAVFENKTPESITEYNRKKEIQNVSKIVRNKHLRLRVKRLLGK